MKQFITGLLLGLGIGVLIAPMRGEETRRQLAERFAEMRGICQKTSNSTITCNRCLVEFHRLVAI